MTLGLGKLSVQKFFNSSTHFNVNKFQYIGVSILTAATNLFAPLDGNTNGIAEAAQQRPAPFSYTAIQIRGRLITNTLTGGETVLLQLRVGGVAVANFPFVAATPLGVFGVSINAPVAQNALHNWALNVAGAGAGQVEVIDMMLIVTQVLI